MIRRLLLLALMGFFLAPSSGCAAEWYINAAAPQSGDGQTPRSPFRKLQEGIDAASDTDTVIVAQGTYAENIHFNSKNIILRSSDPLDPTVVANTIIDGGHKSTVVMFGGTEEASCMLRGFTIRNGSADHGGGIFCWYSSPTISHCVITENSAAENGGGLYGCSGTVEHCTITGNSAKFGGGLACCDATIRDTSVTENTASQVGGGLYDCGGTIHNNTIVANTAQWGGGLGLCSGTVRDNVISANEAHGQVGGGLCECNGAIQNNTITGNSARWGGGLGFCDGTIRNNVVSANRAVDQFGGGLSECNGIIQNNTIVGNSAGWGGGLGFCNGTIHNCIVWGNTADNEGHQLFQCMRPTYSCIQDWTKGGEGNIAPPSAGFVDLEGADGIAATYKDNDYHLVTTSPCVDSGENENWMFGAVDLDGNPRVWPGKSSCTVDMGAYEHGYFPFRILHASKTPQGGMSFTWSSRPGDSYTLWSCDELSAGLWTEEATVASGGETTSWTDVDMTSASKFYRIQIQ